MYNTLEDALKKIDQMIENKRKTNINLGTPKIGSTVGVCMNCGAPIEIRQPWLSKIEVVNDGYYLIHCKNEDCHNYGGMEIKLNDLYLIDFVTWDEQYIFEQESQNLRSHSIDSNIIPFNKDRAKANHE